MFKTILREEREKLQLTQADLCEHFNVSQQTIGSWETGRTQPSNDMLLVIADFFEVSVDYLLGRHLLYNSNKPNISYLRETYSKYLTIDQQLNLIIDNLRDPMQISVFHNSQLSPNKQEALAQKLEMLLKKL